MNDIVVGIDVGSTDATGFCVAEKLPDGTVFVHDSGLCEFREVSPMRVRKLRKRGEYCKFSHWTVAGHARYTWIRRL